MKGPIYAADGPAWQAEGVSSGAAEIELAHRVILIGDTGLFLEDDPTLAALGRWTDAAPSSSVVFLGDNIYNEGLVEDDRERGEKVLTQLLQSTSSPKYFIPGNHDWGFSPKGMNSEAILNQQTFLDAWSASPTTFSPRDGCMGPVEHVLHDAPPGRRRRRFDRRRSDAVDQPATARSLPDGRDEVFLRAGTRQGARNATPRTS